MYLVLIYELKFMYKLHVKGSPTLYLSFRVKILIHVMYCELNYSRLYQSLHLRVECIRADPAVTLGYRQFPSSV